MRVGCKARTADGIREVGKPVRHVQEQVVTRNVVLFGACWVLSLEG